MTKKNGSGHCQRTSGREVISQTPLLLTWKESLLASLILIYITVIVCLKNFQKNADIPLKYNLG